MNLKHEKALQAASYTNLGKGEKMEFHRVSWDDVNSMSKHLAGLLPGKIIIPWERGGLVVTGIMVHYGCSITIDHRQADVIVDDIADTGETVYKLRQLRIQVATLIVRKGCSTLPDFWALELDTEKYILFPWENEAEVLKQDSFRTND